MTGKRSLMAWLLAFILASPAQTQDPTAATPVVGLRENRPQSFALTGATVVVRPGKTIEDAIVLIEGSAIRSVGHDVKIPAGAKEIDCSGATIYAGLIDAWGEADVPLAQSDAAYWNSNVTPQRSAKSVAAGTISDASKLRSQGITVRLVAPRGGIVKGSSSVALLGGGKSGRKLLKEHAWQHLQLTVPRTGSRPRYPNSPMGAVALLRQSMLDADWYRSAWNAYRAKTDLPRPETNLALDVLSKAIKNDTFVIDAPNERMSIRADAIAREFSLQMIIRGSGREYRSLDEISRAGRVLLLPVDFPDAPNVKSSWTASETTLQDLLHWDLAPENPARLVDAGVRICLTTDGLDDPASFLKQVRKAVQRGLSPEAALDAMTTEPAKQLGIDHIAGSIQPGMLANLLIASGDLFDDKSKVLETWVAGEQFVMSPISKRDEPLTGHWSVVFRAGKATAAANLEFEQNGDKLSAKLTAKLPGEDDAEQSVKLADLIRQRDRMTATVRLDELDSSLPAGVSRINLLTIAGQGEGVDVLGTITLPDGRSEPIRLSPIPNDAAEGDKESKSDSESAGDSQAGETDKEDADEEVKQEDDAAETEEPQPESIASVPTPLLYPLGASGLTERKTGSEFVLFRGATVWTCESAGVIESGDVLIQDGKVVAVGEKLDLPPECRVVDVRGKHITPGLIDCHSHMGTDGGVNESGQTVTAEVRIGDFIDNTDINIYRQLAGGLTTSNILHGSANPIGGQNLVVKLRWGETMDGLRMAEAPAGIKFALGENVKRSQSRYPNTRMGVEQIIRDQLLAAREYAAAWRRWRAGQRDSLPPRVDLQLEAIAEIQRGERWIHCHSYRQDEIVATLDVLEEFGVQIGTLQHILEGYKVADRMAKHGAMGSSFSDWWAYKFEVFDAIPYNGALMHDRGVVVSFNSDDRELARHLNNEAAKATKYGGVPEQEALKFVTLNPAKQLRIDEHVGSLAPGKDADLVIWSGRPLSTLTRCEQTWIDGRRYFDLEEDKQMRQRDGELRASLVQKALDSKKSAGKPKTKVSEEDRWVRRDIYCVAFGAAKHENAEHEQK